MWIVLSLLALTASLTGQAQQFDVTGLSLGSSYDLAFQKLTTEGFQMSRVTFPSADMQASFGLKIGADDSPSHSSKEGYALQGINGRLVLVDDGVDFSTEREPNTDVTVIRSVIESIVLRNTMKEAERRFSDNGGSNR